MSIGDRTAPIYQEFIPTNDTNGTLWIHTPCEELVKQCTNGKGSPSTSALLNHARTCHSGYIANAKQLKKGLELYFFSVMLVTSPGHAPALVGRGLPRPAHLAVGQVPVTIHIIKG